MDTRIDKLEMQGFKSFAKKTTILFPVNFNCVAGPNGSGKSNVLDSICFVLGRTRAKSMRAGTMKEIIFNGGEKSKTADFAKVSIHFDNKNKKMPVEEEQVIVSRKVNRNGVSIYKLNGKTVTREKIIEILRNVHIHPDGHNIILQGDITEIIEMNPIERRGIIDEIAGISEFDEKRTKAQRELGIVEERLGKTAIILGEKETQMVKLEAEKDSAEKYDSSTKELDKLRASLATRRLDEAEGAMTDLDKKITEREEQSKKINIEFDSISGAFEDREKELESLRKNLVDKSRDIGIMKEIEKIKSKIEMDKSRIESGIMEIKRLDELVQRMEILKEKQVEDSASNAVKSILDLKKNNDKIYGVISQLMKVPGKYQTAIEVCAGNHLHDVVVLDKDTAVDCVNYLKRNKIGRATLLPLDKIQERQNDHLRKYLNEEGVVGFAINLIDFDKRYWHAFSFIFGDTIIVDTIETAKRIGFTNARFVTLDGDLVERSGAVIGGFYRKSKSTLIDFGDIEKYSGSKQAIEIGIKDFEIEISVLEKQMSELLKKEEKGGAELTELEEKRKETEKEITELKLKRKDLYDNKATEQEYINRMKINRARLEAELDNIRAEFNNYKDRAKELYKLEPDALEKKIREVIVEIQKLGPINQKAVEEYTDIKTVYSELKEKVDKLIEERERVVKMLLEIEGKRKDVFIETLNAVSEHFEKVFNDLTGGFGKLRLEGYGEVVESEDGQKTEQGLEDSGLVIEANPKGNKVLNIDSMSGGEKTLTALAFLFSIQRFRPAPFYILDEIDAALDKPNTKKMVDLISKYSENAQFIVISHNDTTIQAADCVYGVSMSEGESKLIGIKMP